MVWLVVDCASRMWKQRQPDDNNSNATQRLLCCQRRNKDCNAALLSRHRPQAVVVALFLFLFLFLRAMGSCCPLSSGRGYWRDGHLRCRGRLCWRRHATSGDKDGRTTTTTMQRRLHCQRRDDNGNATAKRHYSHSVGNNSVVA